MIVDSTRNWKSYIGIAPYFEEAVNFALTLTDKAPGKYVCETVPEGAVFAMVQEGDTQPYDEGKVEAHRKYLDMQIMLDGGESVYYTDIEGMEEIVPYVDDIVFYGKAGQPVAIRAGMFYLVLPQDGHMPCRHLPEGPGRYRKIVLKVRV